MKKTVIGFIFGLVLALSVSVAADTVFQFTPSQNAFYGNGKKLNMTSYIYQNKNHAGLRDILEPFGFKFEVIGTDVFIQSPLTDLETVAKNVKDSCVMIYAYKSDKTYTQGSGWVYKGYIITAKHVVEGAEKIDIFTDDSIYGVSGTVHYKDPTLDVAVLKANTGLPSVTLGDSDKLKEGEKLVSITSPQGVMNTIDECVNSGLGEFDKGRLMVVTDSSMTDGSSGGAIFNYISEVTAMSIAKADNVNEVLTAIPINDLKPILKNLK